MKAVYRRLDAFGAHFRAMIAKEAVRPYDGPMGVFEGMGEYDE
jgi:hypothetical protein